MRAAVEGGRLEVKVSTLEGSA
jgi:hypothetical protein